MAQYAQFDPAQPAPQPVIGWYDTELLSYPSMPSAECLLAVTQEQWQARISNPSGWAVQNGALVQAQAVAPATSPAVQAQMALDASDTTIIRCYEHAVAVPAEWVAYRAALRAVVGGTSTTMPARPAYPAGT